jgi:hypothetical protein
MLVLYKINFISLLTRLVALLSLTSALGGMSDQLQTPVALAMGKELLRPLNRKLGVRGGGLDAVEMKN